MNRRDFIKASMGSTALGLAATQLASVARADGVAPGRFVFIYTPAGREPSWRTNTPGTDFRLGPTMQMFEPYRRKMIIFDGFTITNFNYRFNAHWGAAQVLLGGHPPLDSGGNSGGALSVGSQRTFDHLLADRIGHTTPVRNIVIGGSDRNNEARGLDLSWSAPRVAESAIHDPDRAFAALFSGNQSIPMATDAQGRQKARLTRQWEKDVLGFSRSRVAAFKNQLGGPERRQLDAYEAQLHGAFEAINLDVQDVLAETSPACKSPPTYPQLTATVSETGDRRHHELQMKTLAAALACGRTRVATYVMAGVRSGLRVPGGRSGHHYHNDNANDHYKAFDLYYGNLIKSFLDELSKYPEGDGTVLDHTAIVWTTDISWAPSYHPHFFHPIYMFGGLPRGKLKMGHYLKYPSFHDNDRKLALAEPRNRRLPEILLTIANQLGASIEPGSFMDTRYFNGLIPEIMG